MEVLDAFGVKKIKITNMHSDQIDGMYLYPKMIPFYIRQKILLECQRTKQSELKVIIEILVKHFRGEKDYVISKTKRSA